MDTICPYDDHLVPYAQEILDGLKPILERLDDSKVAPGSGITWKKDKRGVAYTLSIIPSAEGVPLLDLKVAPDHCILGYADSEQVEAFNISSDRKSLVRQVLDLTERYLSGITIIERYNRKSTLLGKDYFWGVDTELDKRACFGSLYDLTFPRKTASVVKRTYRFLR